MYINLPCFNVTVKLSEERPLHARSDCEWDCGQRPQQRRLVLTPLETMNLQQNCRLCDCKCAFIFLAASSSFAFQNLPNQSASSKESIFPPSRLTIVISILHFIPCHLTLANFPCHAKKTVTGLPKKGGVWMGLMKRDEFISLASMISFTWLSRFQSLSKRALIAASISKRCTSFCALSKSPSHCQGFLVSNSLARRIWRVNITQARRSDGLKFLLMLRLFFLQTMCEDAGTHPVCVHCLSVCVCVVVCLFRNPFLEIQLSRINPLRWNMLRSPNAAESPTQLLFFLGVCFPRDFFNPLALWIGALNYGRNVPSCAKLIVQIWREAASLTRLSFLTKASDCEVSKVFST